MNKRQEKQWRRTPAVAYRLSDGRRFQADSLTALAAKMGVTNTGGINIAARTRHIYVHEWFICHLKDEKNLKAEIEHWMKWYAGQRGKCKTNGDAPKPERVPLRIDSRTIIYVKPENANERYAEEYRQRLLKTQR